MSGDTDGGERRRHRPASDDALESVFESFDGWRDPGVDPGHDSDSDTALVVSCLLSECTFGRTLWPIEPSWNVVGVRTAGTQTRALYDGEPVLDGDLAHHTTERDVTAVLVVGHTRCDVVADAHERYLHPATDSPAGITARLAPLVSLVEAAADAGVIDESTSARTARARLVEYTVVRQVTFLQRTLPDSIGIVGYVHDQTGAYGTFPGKHYLVALDGDTDPVGIRARLPDERSVRVGSLL